MISNTIEQRVRRIKEHRERQECLFTEECLRATCAFRAQFQARHGRNLRLEDCPEICPYFPKVRSGELPQRGGRK